MEHGRADHPDRSHLIQHVENARQRYELFHGDGFLSERLPVGTRIIYPPAPLAGAPDVRAAIEQAIDHPMGCDPLNAQLRPGMKVTIVFDDISLTLPPMRSPDFRETAIELLLERLSAAGIEDIHLISAIGLHRRMTPKELRAMVGKRVFNRFHPSCQLYNHDGEDRENLVALGDTEQGEDVEVNRRAVESDLVIYLNLCLTAMDGGHKSINTGITSYKSLRHHHNPAVLSESSLMEPRHSGLHASLGRMGSLVNEHLNVFHIESTYNAATFPSMFGFLEKPEHRWGAWDRINFGINKTATDAISRNLARSIFMSMRAPYGVTSVQAGTTDLVHDRTLENIYRQQVVPVEGQADVLIAGTPYVGPYNVNSIMNPILVHCLMLGYMFNMFTGKPLVKKGGVLIMSHPMESRFHEGHHPSYVELFERVLPEMTDPRQIAETYEAEFAENPTYLRMYREGYAYHGVHALYMWYWGVRALDHLGKVIVLKPQNAKAVEAAHRMGYDTASSMSEALEKAHSVVGSSPEVTLYHWPPIFLCDVH